MMALLDRSTCSKTGTWGAKVPVSDLLPADEEIGQERSGIGHVPVLKGVKGTSVRLLPLNIRTRLAEQCDPNHMWRKKLFSCLTPALYFGLPTRLGMSLPIPLTGGPSLNPLRGPTEPALT
jgi:hypothetical protein